MTTHNDNSSALQSTTNILVDSEAATTTLQNVTEGLSGLLQLVSGDLELRGDITGYGRLVSQQLKLSSDAICHSLESLDRYGLQD